MDPTLDWQTDKLAARLGALLPGLAVEVLGETGSTNSLLAERARSEARPVLLVAEHQSGGRGRMGRSWVSAPGSSLTFSLGLPLAPADWSGLSLAVGCALADALEPAGTRLQLKWPNDLWLDGRKLGGILIESQPLGPERYLIVGVGLNIRVISTADASQFGSGFAALNELEPGIEAPSALARVAPALLGAVLDFGSERFTPWQQRFERRDLTRGRKVTAGELQGVARGVSAAGELMLQTDAGMRSIASGEVSLRMES
ncbi:MAG: biotin--[acetyl-CoA-carboxylase] ligase [Paucibacter sp.]|nr:biotin--[acetyl-CoA-carboxylase] ligase [Roseateles sp.]